ncbi:MAG: hypothetical protein ACPGWM_11585, partial [Flavobacteriales bacterium]
YVTKVDAPEFLFTRIEQKLKNQSVGSFSNAISWSMISAFAVLIIVNVFLFQNSESTAQTDESEYGAVFTAQSSNHTFYYE